MNRADPENLYGMLTRSDRRRSSFVPDRETTDRTERQ